MRQAGPTTIRERVQDCLQPRSLRRLDRHASGAKGLDAEQEGSDRVNGIGSFDCLPNRNAEVITKPLCIQRGMSILTCESDGYSLSPAALRQVESHIHHVHEHRAYNLP